MALLYPVKCDEITYFTGVINIYYLGYVFVVQALACWASGVLIPAR